MKAILLALAVVGGLSGCAAYVDPYGGVGASVNVPGPYYRGDGGYRHYRGDRDGDGVPNRYDNRPNNPRRY